MTRWLCVGVELCAGDLKACGHNKDFQHAHKTLFTVQLSEQRGY